MDSAKIKSFYFLIASIIFIFGIILASLGVFKGIPSYAFMFLIATFLLFLIFFINNDNLFVGLALVVIFLISIVRYNIFNEIKANNIKNFTSYPSAKVLVHGKIVSDPVKKTKTKNIESFTLKASSLKTNNSWQKISGFSLVNIYNDKNIRYQYGDTIVLEAYLKKPFTFNKKSKFDYKKYLADKRIHSILSVNKGLFSKKLGENKKISTKIIRKIYHIRSKLEAHINHYLRYPYNSILDAILLGKRENIPKHIKSAFANTGTLHILAISGLHIGIIYFVLRIILRIFRVQNNLAVGLAILFLICFTVLSGARPSIVRASTMFSILALGDIFKRKISILNLIGLSCFIILVANPNQLFDVGFIFSYMAILSIVVVSPRLYRAFHADEPLRRGDSISKKIKYYSLKSISVSLAAWLGLLPLIAYFFGVISPIVVVANLIVIPLLFMVMGSGIVLISLGIFLKFLAPIFAESTWFFTFSIIKCINFLEKIPFSYFKVKSFGMHFVLIYYALMCIILLRKRKII